MLSSVQASAVCGLPRGGDPAARSATIQDALGHRRGARETGSLRQRWRGLLDFGVLSGCHGGDGAAATGYVAAVGKVAAWDGVPEGRRRVMQANRSKGTKPELVLRRALHALGYRFRLHRRSLPGTPDLVFPGRGAAIQVHGCFWHQHEGCSKAHLPRTRQDYWIPKLRRNVERDKESVARLEAMGWRTLTVWECELGHPAAATARAADFLGPPGPPGACRGG